MQSDEKTIREENQHALQSAKQLLIGRAESEHSCFESLLNLNRAALLMLCAPDPGDADLAALNEVLLIQDTLIKAGYAHYLLRKKPVTD